MRYAYVPVLVLVILLMGCNPSDRRPGTWLTGEVADGWPQDWASAREQKEIYLQVSTPYLIPHSITIWCATLDGDLYVAAGGAADKRWPGWVDDDPDVKLLIDGRLYRARLVPLTEPAEISALQSVYRAKYQLSGDGPLDGSTRYWRVTPPAA